MAPLTDSTAPPTPTPPPAPSVADLYGPQGKLVAAPPTTPAGVNHGVSGSYAPAPVPDTSASNPYTASSPSDRVTVPSLNQMKQGVKEGAERVRTAITGDVNTNRNLPEKVAEENASAAAQGSNYQAARLAAIAHLKAQRIVKYGETRSSDPKVEAHDAAIDDQIEKLQDPSELNLWEDLGRPALSLGALTKLPVLHGALNFLSGLTSAQNVGMMGGAGAAGTAAAEANDIAARAAGSAFSIQMLHGAGQQVAQAYVDAKNGEWGAAADDLTEAVASGYMGRSAARHAAGEMGTDVLNRVDSHLKETAATVKSAGKEEITNAVNAKAPTGSTEAGKN